MRMSYKNPRLKVLEEVLKEQVYGEQSHPAVFSRHTDTVPVVSGNGIRGVLRRLAHYDFCQRVGIAKLAAERYHQLFTGGAITGETGEESLEARRAFIAADPMIGLFGSAIGNQTMHGALVVGQASPECREKGTGPASYHELLEIVFGTRLDSEKLESQLDVVGAESKERATQMLYQYETLVAGTRLRHHFALRGTDPLLVSAFWHLLSLFVESPYVAARAAIGHGALDLTALAAQIPAGGADLYLAHLADNQASIRAFFRREVMRQSDYRTPGAEKQPWAYWLGAYRAHALTASYQRRVAEAREVVRGFLARHQPERVRISLSGGKDSTALALL